MYGIAIFLFLLPFYLNFENKYMFMHFSHDFIKSMLTHFIYPLPLKRSPFSQNPGKWGQLLYQRIMKPFHRNTRTFHGGGGYCNT